MESNSELQNTFPILSRILLEYEDQTLKVFSLDGSVIKPNDSTLSASGHSVSRQQSHSDERHGSVEKSLLDETLTTEHLKCLTQVFSKQSEQLSVSEHVLRNELVKSYQGLRCREVEVRRLTSDQQRTGVEIEELTASLFEEANKMVQDANIKRMATEKQLKEANDKIDILLAEVSALKTLVITSTPSKPNPHLNPQLAKAQNLDVVKGHKRSTSHHSLGMLLNNFSHLSNNNNTTITDVSSVKSPSIDLNLLERFREWKSKPSLISEQSDFVNQIRQDDIEPCLRFVNKQISEKLYEGIVSNTLIIEPASKSCDLEHRKCALTEQLSKCPFNLKLGEVSYTVSLPARNRVIAVCDLFTYLRYISQGFVKCSDTSMLEEITRLRKKICIARLGVDE